MSLRGRWAIGALAAPLFLAGCSLVPMKRHLPVPKAPSNVETVTPEDLVAQVNRRWDDFQSLTASVEIQATLLKAQQGLATDYPSVRGWIVMQKPDNLRIAGQYLGVRVFDMASDGKTFTLLMPPKNKAIQGPNAVVKKKLENQFENLRPQFFFDSMVVRGLDPDNFYTVTSDIETIEDVAKKHLFTMPEYVLSITRHGSEGHRDVPIRVVTFHRDDLLPYNQDLYDAEGKLESQVTYSQYKNFGDEKFPTKVTIKRPMEGIQLVLTVEKVDKNVKLPADEFKVKIPPGTEIQHLE